jgi:hypothetical protein
VVQAAEEPQMKEWRQRQLLECSGCCMQHTEAEVSIGKSVLITMTYRVKEVVAVPVPSVEQFGGLALAFCPCIAVCER